MTTTRTDLKNLSATGSSAENQLVVRCQQRLPGWEQALSDWLKGQESWIQRHCYARLGCQFDAEDATQEVMIRALRGIHGFQNRSSLRTWLSHIADNFCNTLYRKNARHWLSDEQRYSLEVSETERATETPAFAAQEAVQKTLGTMVKKNQDVLRLRFFEELSLEDIAHSLDITLSATKMRLYRAMSSFKQAYEILLMEDEDVTYS